MGSTDEMYGPEQWCERAAAVAGSRGCAIIGAMPHRPGPRRVAALARVDVVGGGVQRWWRQEAPPTCPGAHPTTAAQLRPGPGRRVQRERPRVLVQRRADELPGQLRVRVVFHSGPSARQRAAGRGAGAPWPTSSSPRRRMASTCGPAARATVLPVPRAYPTQRCAPGRTGARSWRTSSRSCTTRSSSRPPADAAGPARAEVRGSAPPLPSRSPGGWSLAPRAARPGARTGGVRGATWRGSNRR